VKEPRPSVKRAVKQHVQKAARELGLEGTPSIRWFDDPIQEPDGGQTWGFVNQDNPTTIYLCKSIPFDLPYIARIVSHEVHHVWEFTNGAQEANEEGAHEFCGRYVQKGIEADMSKLYEKLDLDALRPEHREAIEELIFENITLADRLRETETRLELRKSKK
jgi:hypothetical protein